MDGFLCSCFAQPIVSPPRARSSSYPYLSVGQEDTRHPTCGLFHIAGKGWKLWLWNWHFSTRVISGHAQSSRKKSWNPLAFSSMENVFIAAAIVVESRLLPINAFKNPHEELGTTIHMKQDSANFKDLQGIYSWEQAVSWTHGWQEWWHVGRLDSLLIFWMMRYMMCAMVKTWYTRVLFFCFVVTSLN